MELTALIFIILLTPAMLLFSILSALLIGALLFNAWVVSQQVTGLIDIALEKFASAVDPLANKIVSITSPVFAGVGAGLNSGVTALFCLVKNKGQLGAGPVESD